MKNKVNIKAQPTQNDQDNEAAGATDEKEPAPQAAGKNPLLSLHKETLRNVAGGICTYEAGSRGPKF